MIALGRSLPVLVIFSLLMIGATLTAGCWTESVGYHQAHTLVLSKFSQNGSLDWSKTYDSLGEASGNRIIQLPQGGYLVTAFVPVPGHFVNYQVQLIHVSGTGEVLSKNIPQHQQCTHAPFIAGDGNIMSIGGSEVCRISPDGAVISTISIPDPGDSGIQTRDGGYITAGVTEERLLRTKEEFTYPENSWNAMCVNQSPPEYTCYKRVQKITVVRSNPDGTELWRYQYSNAGSVDHLGTVHESPDGKGYSIYPAYYDIVPGNVTNQVLIIQLTNDGKLRSVVNLSDVPERTVVLPNRSSGQLMPILVIDKPPTLVFFDHEGNPVEKQYLNPDYTGITQISDNAFVAVLGQRPVTFDSTGNSIREGALPRSTVTGEVSQVITTADGGILVMGNIQKGSTFWPNP